MLNTTNEPHIVSSHICLSDDEECDLIIGHKIILLKFSSSFELSLVARDPEAFLPKGSYKRYKQWLHRARILCEEFSLEFHPLAAFKTLV